ncbi:DUF1642 domain-containing protein [Enterococcus faecium]|uniref:DUF1642 domain-containing protein n=1 Tax=Enterococcus faecium TaxID=1352 RepID=UPI000A34FDDD|nr:DUF1642 domain-containing protein [Enterococcus faecium]EMF0361945.1 DUF1642 domain-containing protein [Enterococcus faecium]NTJ95883.1 DUF1642 domain-containing protein [Enterococcus faecium]OTO06967.1 hypothetical protein A5801_001007 [Enterococcus faecium]RXW85636.1 DUF1642 domain-containing protein [Enterococcus faecium]RXW92986.1 DUF1642 domain-containing protein [Enterococcus faecium]
MNKKVLIDKQALIDELMKIPGVGSNSDALETIKRFPSYEPQKPVVPKFVAEWIEYAKKKGDSLAISFKPWNLYGVEYSKADRWIEDNQETFARAWIDGYEVEKVQKYIVKIGKLYLKEPLGDTSNSTILTTWDKKCAYPFSSFHMADKHADKFEGAVEEVAEG